MSHARHFPPQSTKHKHGLSPREREILRFAATGASNKEIAAALGIGERTVEHHVFNACQHLGCTNRLAAVVRAGILRSGHAD